MKEFLRKNIAFLIPVLIFIITGIVFLSLFSKGEIHLAQNRWYHAYADIFFTYNTHLGDGLIFPFIAILLAFVKWRYFLGFTIASVLTLLIVGFLKNAVFDDMPRPSTFFDGSEELRTVEGVEIHGRNSFPSGHTTYAFACWGFIAFIIRRHWMKFMLFLLAASIGYSRIYLSQHFLVDVVTGAALGTTLAILSYLVMMRLKFSWTDNKLSMIKRRRL